VAYRTDVTARDKGGAIIAVVAVHAALLLALLNLSGTIDERDVQSALSVIDLAKPPPPPPPPAPSRQRPKPKEKPAASAPKNVKSQATPVVAPKPRIETPPVQKIVASNTPRQGTVPTQGASDVRGPGTGAGGTGKGTGSGGNGSGGGGDNDVADPPHLATPVLSGRDIPRDLIDRWPPGATVFMRLRIDARGTVAECTVDRGTGDPAIDNGLCNIAHDRLRFRPAVNRSGQAVAGWFGYAQRPPR
jgi:periplasmic protein TonB